MLARREMPAEYWQWNARWGAPDGRPGYTWWPLRHTQHDIRRRGPFAYQPNNSTRTFEYPWAHAAVSGRGAGLAVVDLGGSLGGLQFVLAREGHRVITVDPGLKAGGLGWNVSADQHRQMCRAFAAPVELRSETIDRAGLADRSVDVLLSVSSLEHFSEPDIAAVAREIPRILKPSGAVVMTVDLFLDVAPFTRRPQNKFGTNIDLCAFLRAAGLTLATGTPAEMCGFDGFSPSAILENLYEYNLGAGYPALAQCFVAVPTR